jgi:hypothetical protein
MNKILFTAFFAFLISCEDREYLREVPKKYLGNYEAEFDQSVGLLKNQIIFYLDVYDKSDTNTYRIDKIIRFGNDKLVILYSNSWIIEMFGESLSATITKKPGESFLGVYNYVLNFEDFDYYKILR